MSYDLMVFNPNAAPKNEKDFLEWYAAQTEWTEEHNYDHPDITTISLRNWYLEMIQTFPDLNGIFTYDHDRNNVFESDYSIGKDIIYVAFSWSLAENAYNTMFKLAAKHSVGFYDTSSDNGCIFFPMNDQLFKINETNKLKEKPWWRIW